ncbi:MAG: S-DNA-T family DNA segregation ATPase FtsK/SpoIIIE, partial [Psychromonas sp.]
MSFDNEIIDKSSPKKSGSTAKKAKAKKKASSTSKDSSTSASPSRKKKIKNTTGILLLFTAVYCFIACISYIATWKADQNLVMNQNFFGFVFAENAAPVQNWLGRVGAWISHLLYFRCFGLSSIAISFIFTLLGFKVLFNIRLLPLKTAINSALIFMVWSSIFLGYFSSFPNYIGGAFGFYINEWLTMTIGGFGTFLFIFVFLYLIVLVMYNPDFSAFYDRIAFWRRDEGEEESQENEESIGVVKSEEDLNVVNTIAPDQIKKDEESDVISFDEDDEDLGQPIKKESPVSDDNFEIEVPIEEESATEKLDVEVPENDEELSKGEINDLQKEFGDYDPTLDLSSYVLPSIDLLKDFGSGGINVDKDELEENKNRIVETLSNYKIDIAKIKATVGPTVTLYEIVPAPGVRISKIKNLEDD